MTSPELASGTDRTAAVLDDEEADIIVNLQGDEPFIEPALLSRMVQVFANPEIEMATPIKRIVNLNELTNPNFVRVVRDKMHFALYFSRAVVPFVRDISDKQQWLKRHRFYKHIGIYAYRKNLLLKLTALPQSSLEQSERLEQLRALENGIRIYTVETEYESTGVDTPEDLELVNKLIQNNKFKIE
jgi:3-deoxy-manno-octulosonate cytidylyltransferase (CMP-KDO synthetase)